MKREDELLKALGRLERERREAEQNDPWRALAAGALTPDETRALELQAGRTAEGRHRLDLYRPVDDGFADRVAARLESCAGPRASTDRGRRGWRGLATMGLALAAAAGLALALVRPSSPPLPTYALEFVGGDRAFRGPDLAEPAPGPVALDSHLALTLRPSVPVEGDVAARLFVRSDARWRAAPAIAERSESGSLRFAGPAGRLLGVERAGDYPLAVVIARPDRLPDDAAALDRLLEDAPARGSADDDDRIRILRSTITIGVPAP